MYRRSWRLVTVVAVGLALTACGGGSPASRVAAVAPTASAGAAAQPGPFTPAKLVGALLTRINGTPATAPATGGSYGSLAQVKAIEQAEGGRMPPGPCTRAALIGLRPGGLDGAPAAAVSFKVGGNGVSEMLAAPSGTAAGAALRRALPAACEHYRASVGGKDYQYTAEEKSVTGIGEQARVLSVRAAGRPGGDIWSVVFRGAGFIGSVTVVGPNASELAVRELGMQAYGFAAKTLS